VFSSRRVEGGGAKVEKNSVLQLRSSGGEKKEVPQWLPVYTDIPSPDRVCTFEKKVE